MIGHGVGDELGPLCAAADAPVAARALRTVARRLPAHGVILVDRLRGDDPLLAELPEGSVREEGAPVLVRNGRTWEEWLASRSSNFRQQLRRRERALLRDHDLRYRLSEDPDRLDEDLTLLMELHRSRWAGGDSAAFTPVREAFHRDFARRALERGWLRLWLAESGGKAVAAWYGFRYGGSEIYYQAGRDPAWNRTAVGMVLLAHRIREAFGDGVEQYCFGVGDEPYKSRFTALDPGLRSVLVGRSATRLAAVAVAGGLTWLPSKARQRLTRRVA
jgi:CelD/BcsL family acetyltransferase involved in cellulose biosynthesis